MFKSEAKLFLSANNNVNSAKILINECKRLIVDFNLEGNSDCKNLKNNINNCNINALVNKIEDTKESLMKLDQGFASEYMTLLQDFLQTSTIDTSNMTDEEKMQYSIQMDAYARDYNQNLLYMLEKYEESGMLTDEMKQQLQYQRELVAQYDIQDKMAVLDSTSNEYIKLFKQNADYDRKLINLNPSLTEEQKANYLKEYNTQYNQNLDALINARDARLKREADEKELKELYATKEENNGFWHPFVESEIEEAILDKKIAMGIASEDEVAYKGMNGWDRFWTDTGTFAASTFTGMFNITEGIGDAFVMLGSAVDIVDKNWASEYISRDISGELYQGIQLSNNMNSYSAYGTWHDAGEAFGGFVGKAGITFAAPWASAALYGLDAMGQSAETSFNNGDEYWAAFGKSVVAGIGGAAEGYGMSKLNIGIRDFLGSGALKTIAKSTGTKVVSVFQPGGLKAAGKGLFELGKSGIKAIPKALKVGGIATLKDADSWIETGCVLANNFVECATTGEWDFKKIAKEAGAVFLTNYFMNFATALAFNIGPNEAKKTFDVIFESDSSIDSSGLISSGTATISDLGEIKKFSDTTEAIKEKFCLTYGLDYYNDENSRKIVNSIMNLIEKNEFADDSVKYLFANLDLLKQQNPNLSIGYWDSGSKFWSGGSVLGMDVKDLDISEMVLSHELGHTIYDTVEGSAKTSWQPELTAKNKEALFMAKENISKNREKVLSMLDECSVASNKAFNETVDWYAGIRETEVKRISNIVDELYSTQNVTELKKMMESGSKMTQVKSILAEAGMSEISIDDLISDKEMVKKIAITQNNINNQVAYCSKLNGSYEFYGDHRKMSSIIDSITQSDESLKFTFGHNKSYWQMSGDLRSYNELLADYVSLSANGRFDVLKKLEEVCGTEIFDDIRETLSGVVGKLGG